MIKKGRINFVFFIAISVLIILTFYLFSKVESLNDSTTKDQILIKNQKQEIDKLSEEKSNLLITSVKQEKEKDESFDQIVTSFSKNYIFYDASKLREKRENLLKVSTKELVDNIISEHTIDQIEEQNKKYDSDKKWEENNVYLSDRDFKNTYLSSKNYENTSEGKLSYIAVIEYETKQKETKTIYTQYIQIFLDVEQKKVVDFKMLEVQSN